MNVLIINLTRFGDLIQTQPVISGYTSLGHRVGLVCLENFASAATLLDGVETVFPFPGSKLLAKLDSDWHLAVESFSGFRDGVFRAFPADRVVNLTPSVSSRLLAYGLSSAGGDVAGFTVDEFGFNADTSAWAAFLQLAGANRGASPFNICDIFRRASGLGGEGNSLRLASPDDVALTKADSMLSVGMPENGRGFLALQMGASEDRRRWPVDHFVRTAELAWERDGLVSVLLGTKGEAHLGENFRARTNCPSIDLIGKTSLTELAGVLQRCDALITNDTGTMHLAAGLGVPICAIFLATAQPWDTGPYRAGNICLEPDMYCHPCEFGAPCLNNHACREAVSPETMYATLKALTDPAADGVFPGARVWRTATDADGFMGLVGLSGHDATDRAAWISMQRAHYLPFLDGGTPVALSRLAENMTVSMREELSKTLTSAHDMLFLLSQQGMLLLRNPRPQAKSKFLASWQRIQTVLGSSKHLNILGKLWMFESQQCGDEFSSLLALAERYRTLFSSLRDEFV